MTFPRDNFLVSVIEAMSSSEYDIHQQHREFHRENPGGWMLTLVTATN